MFLSIKGCCTGAWPALPDPQLEAPAKLRKTSWFRHRLAFHDAHGHSPWAGKGEGLGGVPLRAAITPPRSSQLHRGEKRAEGALGREVGSD